MTVGDILVLLILGTLVGGILGSRYRKKKAGKQPGCCGCPHAGTCGLSKGCGKRE